jgi:hypothetical protein
LRRDSFPRIIIDDPVFVVVSSLISELLDTDVIRRAMSISRVRLADMADHVGASGAVNGAPEQSY